MARKTIFLILVGLLTLGLSAGPIGAEGGDEQEKATIGAIAKVAPSVVQIVTQGGTDIIRTGKRGQIFRKALGPTTGVVVSKDGYIISSAFNFINNPSSILVEVPGRKEKYIAKKIATDQSRMLTLLRIDAKDLPVPEVVPKKEWIWFAHAVISHGRQVCKARKPECGACCLSAHCPSRMG